MIMAELIVNCGRRRIGKNTLVNQFAENSIRNKFEGIEGEKTLYYIK